MKTKMKIIGVKKKWLMVVSRTYDLSYFKCI